MAVSGTGLDGDGVGLIQSLWDATRNDVNHEEEHMSVMMGMRIAVDPKRFEEVINSNQERLMGISERAKQAGAIHHAFYASEAGDEVLVVDEWPDAESFQQFFSNSPDIGEMMGQAGVSSEPQPVFWRELDTPDKF